MTSEQIAEIKARREAAYEVIENMSCFFIDEIGRHPHEILAQSNVDTELLLSTLEAEKARADEYEKRWMDIDKAQNDLFLSQCEWKQRAEAAEERCLALERGIKTLSFACLLCKDTESRTAFRCDGCTTSENELWQFDSDRFSGKLENADNTKDADADSGVEQVTGKLDGGSE